MTKIQQTKQELLKHLDENVSFLNASAAAFDSGFTSEAKRLAVTIRVLIHDTQKSKSLLGMLNIKDNTGYLDTARNLIPGNLVSHHGLVGIKVGIKSFSKNASYWAPLSEKLPERSYDFISFSEWWNKIVIKDNNGNSFSRKDLVLALANKDGGAHVDVSLDATYANLTRNNSVGLETTDGVNIVPIDEVELHSVRQIAYEILTSLEALN